MAPGWSAGGALAQEAQRARWRRPSRQRERPAGVALAPSQGPDEGSARQPSIVGGGGSVQRGQGEPARQDPIRGGRHASAAAFDQRADRALVQPRRTRAPQQRRRRRKDQRYRRHEPTGRGGCLNVNEALDIPLLKRHLPGWPRP